MYLSTSVVALGFVTCSHYINHNMYLSILFLHQVFCCHMFTLHKPQHVSVHLSILVLSSGFLLLHVNIKLIRPPYFRFSNITCSHSAITCSHNSNPLISFQALSLCCHTFLRPHPIAHSHNTNIILTKPPVSCIQITIQPRSILLCQQPSS